jgi:hypothetical protein
MASLPIDVGNVVAHETSLGSPDLIGEKVYRRFAMGLPAGIFRSSHRRLRNRIDDRFLCNPVRFGSGGRKRPLVAPVLPNSSEFNSEEPVFPEDS